MRAITPEEIDQIVGGLRMTPTARTKSGYPVFNEPPVHVSATPYPSYTSPWRWAAGPPSDPSGPSQPSGPSGGGNGGGHEDYSYENNPVLESKPITELLQEAGLLDELNKLNITVKLGVSPRETVANTGSYDPVNNTIYVPANIASEPYAAASEILHDLGHAVHPEQPMSNYSTEQSYVHAMMVDEGLAAEEAALGADNYAKAQHIANPDNSPILPPANTVAEEQAMLNVYNDGINAGESASQIAETLAPMMANHVLGDHHTTEKEYYQEQWEKHH